MLQGLIAAAPYILAGVQMAGTIGASHYGGKRLERQQEENERATARASMISALTGGSARPQPNIIGSAGESAFNTLGNIGRIGASTLPFIKSAAPRVTTVSTPPSTPPLTPMPSRISGGVYNPIPQDWDRITRMLGGI